MPTVSPTDRDLFERRSFAHFATITPRGFPHVTPVWIDYDVDRNRVLVNTERHRRKTKNVERNPRVGLCVLDPSDPYRRLSVIGDVEDIRTKGAREHIEALAHRYVDGPYPGTIESERVVLEVRPLEIF